MKAVISGKFLNSKINGIPRYAMEVVKHMDPLAEGMDIEICYPADLSEDKIPHFKNIKPVPFGKRKRVGYSVRRKICSTQKCAVCKFSQPGWAL